MEKIKALLYCCKVKPYLWKYWFSGDNGNGYNYEISLSSEEWKDEGTILNGTIVAECDFDVEEITPSTWNVETERRILKGSCLKEHQLFDYIIKGDENESQNPFYALHITNIKVFDKPRELSDYCTKQCQFRKCSTCKYGKNNITCLTIDTPIAKAPKNMMYAYDNLEMKILISIQPEELCRILNGEQAILIKKQVLNCMKEKM